MAVPTVPKIGVPVSSVKTGAVRVMRGSTAIPVVMASPAGAVIPTLLQVAPSSSER